MGHAENDPVDVWARLIHLLEFIMGLPEDQDRHGLLRQWLGRHPIDFPALVLKALDLEVFEAYQKRSVRSSLLKHV